MKNKVLIMAALLLGFVQNAAVLPASMMIVNLEPRIIMAIEKPTATIMPTTTATATIIPTSTPIPSPTITPTPTLDPETYRQFVLSYLDENDRIFARLKELGDAVQISPMIIKNQQWLDQNMAATADLRENNNKLLLYDPVLVPDNFKETHGFLIMAAKEFLSFCDDYEIGISITDAGFINKAKAHLLEAIRLMGKAKSNLPAAL